MKSLRVLLLILSLLGTQHAFSQEKKVNEIYSMMLFNFVKYVQWPEVHRGEFTIGVIGNQEMFNTLSSAYGGKQKGNKIITIKKFSSASEVTECDVLFIDRSKSAEFEGINSKVKGQNTLVVTEKEGLGQRGSCINFKKVDDKIRFEINQHAFEEANLKVSGALTSLGIMI